MFMSENKPLDRDVSRQIMLTHCVSLASLPVCLLNIFTQHSGWHRSLHRRPKTSHAMSLSLILTHTLLTRNTHCRRLLIDTPCFQTPISTCLTNSLPYDMMSLSSWHFAIDEGVS